MRRHGISEPLADETVPFFAGIGVSVTDDELAKQVDRNLREQEIVMDIGGFYKNVMRVQPPLSISREQLEVVVGGLKAVIETEGTE